MNEFNELEFKYRADEIKVDKFLDLMTSLDIVSQKDVSSWDFYYTNEKEYDFLRYRESTSPELTIKRKMNTNNNWQRIEVDLPLDGERLTTTIVDKFAELLGYKNRKCIYKTCFIYYLKYINFVYYVVYDANMNEKGRFIEVEFNKDKLAKESHMVEEEMKRGQEILLKIGLTPQHRMKKSLYEIFIK